MRLRAVLTIVAVIVAAVGTSRADFKYTQQTKITGGALAGVTKTLGVFSKSARQATEPQLTTTMVRGNRMRTENTGTIEIIDLDGKRFIHVDTVKKTYWIQTFDQFKQQIEQAKQKAQAEQAKAAAKHDDASTVTMTPKFDVQATGQTRTVMNIPTKEMKMRVDMIMKSTDPKTEADLEKSNATMYMTADAWSGEVPGYEEVREFQKKMAKELDWLPGTIGMSNSQMSQAADEFKKSAIKIDGMPIVQYSSLGMAGNGRDAQGQSAQTSQPAQQQSNDNSTSSNPRDAVAKSLGGLFKKKQQPDDKSANANAGDASLPPPPPSMPGSMMDLTTQVMSYSKDSLDASLFDVPAGYTQVQADTNVK